MKPTQRNATQSHEFSDNARTLNRTDSVSLTERVRPRASSDSSAYPQRAPRKVLATERAPRAHTDDRRQLECGNATGGDRRRGNEPATPEWPAAVAHPFDVGARLPSRPGLPTTIPLVHNATHPLDTAAIHQLKDEPMLQIRANVPSMAALHAASLDLVDEPDGAFLDQAAAARWYAAHAQAEGTAENHEVRWRYVLRRCEELNTWPLPMESRSACYLIADMAMQHYSLGSIRNVRNTIRKAHVMAGHPDPTRGENFLAVYQGVAREIGMHYPNRKIAILASDMLQIAHAVRQHPIPIVGVQEWAVLTTGYYGALRRAELVALNHSDARFTPEGVALLIRRSKTDQYGQSAEIFVGRLDDPFVCGVAALERWLRAAHIDNGPIFRRILPGARVSAARLSDRTVARAVQRYARTLNVDAKLLGAHSLRAGFVTQALLNGVSEPQIAAHTRHTSFESLAVYFRPRKPTNLSKLVLG